MLTLIIILLALLLATYVVFPTHYDYYFMLIKVYIKSYWFDGIVFIVVCFSFFMLMKWGVDIAISHPMYTGN